MSNKTNWIFVNIAEKQQSAEKEEAGLNRVNSVFSGITMKICSFIFLTIFLSTGCSNENRFSNIVKRNMKEVDGTIVFLDLTSSQEVIFNQSLSEAGMTPCSTFKIWNALIGIESNLINSWNDNFYKWDGVKRPYQEWNRDLTLQEAFKVSCVPAFQNLARKIGSERMQYWINAISYGDKDISSGIDVFWLPRPDRKSILISPKEQAFLIKKLVNNQLSFSEKSKHILKNLMISESTQNGIMYGKTGTGMNIHGVTDNNIGWYVGYVISKKGEFSFACLIRGKEISGKDAKLMVENILIQSGML